MRHFIKLLVLICLTLGLWGANEVTRDPVSAQSPEFTKSDLHKFYLSYLQKKTGITDFEWSVEEINELELIPSPAGLLKNYFNKYLIWAKNSTQKQIWGFRPVDTPTGCTSGCTPVIFHLVVDKNGSVVDLLEEANTPLRKIWHQEFTPAERKKALLLAQSMPEKLEFIEEPLDLTNNQGAFPPQTWTFFKDVLIPGGAYTSYAIYKSALTTKYFVNGRGDQIAMLTKERSRIMPIFSQQVRDLKDLQKILFEIEKVMKGKLSNESRKELLRQVLIISGYFVMLSDEHSLDFKFLIKHLNIYHDYYSQHLQSIFVKLLTNLLSNKKGASLILELQKSYKGWSKLAKPIQSYLPILASGILEQKAMTKKLTTKIETRAFIEFVMDNNQLLEYAIKTLLAVGDHNAAVIAIATMKARFPHHTLDQSIKLPPQVQHKLKHAEKSALESYYMSLMREFLLTDQEIPSIDGTKPFSTTSSKTISLTASKEKQIYLFFAPWCPHCYELIKTLSEQAPASLWQRIQLVAIFLEGDYKSKIEEFITQTGLKQKQLKSFQNIIALPLNQDVQNFYDKMGMFTVPQIVATNKQGKIINFSMKISLDKEKDLVRDINHILDAF